MRTSLWRPSFGAPFLAVGLAAALLLYAWALLFWHLSVFWRLLPDYQYGWIIPFLTAVLVWRRRHLLAARESQDGKWYSPLIVALALSLVPLRVILDANLDWRAAVWCLAAVVVCLTLACADLFGGKRWWQTLLFPCLFVLTGVPWLGRFEIPVTTGLMRFGAFVATEFLNALGVAAYQRGSVVETGAGLIGIDEACSGIKSLQTTVAVALFLSDWTRFRGVGRLWVVAVGVALATLTNLARIVWLAWFGSQGGPAAIERWHDVAGTLAFGAACFALILVVRAWAGAGPPASGPGPGPTVEARGLPGARPPLGILAVAVLCPFLAETLRVWWYLPSAAAANARWTVAWPDGAGTAKARPVPVSAEIRAQLGCDRAEGVRWTPVPGTEWVGYFFAWQAGERAYFARSQHSPEICLPATGRRLTQDLGYFDYGAFGRTLRVRQMVFEDEAGPLQVFFIMDGAAVTNTDDQQKADRAGSRLRAVWQRRREADRRSLELIALGYEDPAVARRQARDLLREILRPGSDVAAL